ncbi:MAG: dTMP kinase [Candidatus Aenigmarchaeota archaeon ex4484_224]|nr:MAG: dTMP kinase [Candidatus Aenigmarchaeota archaeon ex4484_224]
MIIVFEGIDGAGTETQSKKLFSFLKSKGLKVFYFDYPNYKKPIGRTIKEILYSKEKVSALAKALLFISDFALNLNEVKEKAKEGIVILDRYFISTLVYQTIEGLELEKIVEILKIVDIPKIDIVFYLDVSPEISFQRKVKEKGKDLDENEKNLELLRKVREKYKEVSKMDLGFWKEWYTIDGEKTIEEVFEEIKKIIDEKI